MPPHMLINTEGSDGLEPIAAGGAGDQDRLGSRPAGVPVDSEPASRRLDVNVVVLKPIGGPITGTNAQLRTRTNELTALGPRRYRTQRLPATPDAFVPHQLDRTSGTRDVVDVVAASVMERGNDTAVRAAGQGGVGLNVDTDPNRRGLDAANVEVIQSQERVSTS